MEAVIDHIYENQAIIRNRQLMKYCMKQSFLINPGPIIPKEVKSGFNSAMFNFPWLEISLLDGNLPTLSMQRDRYFGETPPELKEYRKVVNWLNQLNRIGSPPLKGSVREC